VMIGDSASDVKAARAFGLPVVVVRSGYGQDDPDDLGADVVIDTLGQARDTIAHLRSAPQAGGAV